MAQLVLRRLEPDYQIKYIKSPLPDEIIVVNFHTEKLAVDECSKIIEQLKKEFPYNQVIGKFDCYDIYRTPCVEAI